MNQLYIHFEFAPVYRFCARMRRASSLSMVYAIALLCSYGINLIVMPSAAAAAGNETDRLALLAFRNQIAASLEGRAFSTWNDTVNYCSWQGITCGSTGGGSSSRRVTVLSLPSQSLVGSLSPFLGNLTSLQELNLGDNHLRGNIPPELSNLVHLRTLNLTANAFGGPVPANLSSCKQLHSIDLGTNQLVGDIPTELSMLPKLKTLYLLVNNLTGTIPSSIGNLSLLTTLALGRNGLHGPIPDSIGAIAGLGFLQVAENQLSGTIPQSLYNLSSLRFIAIATNKLHGSLPPTLGITLSKLETLYVGGNWLTGRIPDSLSNASGLINLDFAENNFTGLVPVDLGKLGALQWLNFEGNRLGTGESDDLKFLPSLSNCTDLEVLDIYNNGFGGMLPNSVANLSTRLSMLILSGNKIYGSIPERIDNLAGLSMVSLEENMLAGHIPNTIGRLQNLQVLSLSGNRLSGEIPDSIGNLTRLDDLRLRDNDLQGSIPFELKNCRRLKFLDFSKNRLDGTIPEDVISIPSLSILFSLAHNSLVGSLPREIGDLKNLGKLDISDNRLSGEIPRELGDCESMEYLNMQGNLLSGSIPLTLSNLKGIQYLDLSRNNLSGQVPNFLERLNFLSYLNLSYNDFEGMVPKGGVFTNASAITVQGNTKLCGGAPTLQLPSCSVQYPKKRRGAMHVIVPIISTLSGLSLLLCLFTSIYCLRKRKKSPPINIPSLKSHKMVSYHDLVKATNGFSSTNLIGEGSFGKVYRGTLDSSYVAVKVLTLDNRGASKSFMAECETLRHVRHRNLVKIMTVCSSEDAIGNEFKALVYEFMSNGSLNDWLHPALEPNQRDYSKALNFYQRLSLSIDIAAALDYLHHQCQVPIVHCDLKPSNVLLDEDMNALVGDFGLAKILLLDDVNTRFQTSSSGIKGSIGYIPPEYGVGGDVSTQGDVYSYGILLLEMFTGKRPIDDSFDNGSCLHEFVRTAYPERVMEILDPQLFAQEVKVETIHGRIGSDEMNNRIKECVVSLVGIGLACSTTSAKERLEMKQVFTKMHAIKVSLLGEENCTPCKIGDFPTSA